MKKNMSQGVATAKNSTEERLTSESLVKLKSSRFNSISNWHLPASLLLLMQRNTKSKHWSILTFVTNVVVNIQVETTRFVDQQNHKELGNQ